MKKNVTGIALALTCTAAFSAAAMASDLTVDDVLALYSEGSAQVNEMNCDVDLGADIAITVPDLDAEQGTISITGSAAMDMGMVLDPFAAHIAMDMAGSAVGQNADVAIDMYMTKKDDGAIGMYMTGDAMGETLDWQYVEIPAEETASVFEMLKNRTVDMSAFQLPFELGEGTVDIEGHTCYPLLATITWADLQNIINTALEQAGDALPEEVSGDNLTQTLEMGGAILGGLVINLEIDVDSETGFPIRAYFDTEGSDWTVPAAMFAQYAEMTNDDGSLMNVDINVNDLHLEYLYDYDTPVEITVPDEAIAAEENGTTIDPSMVEDLGAEVEDLGAEVEDLGAEVEPETAAE